MASRAGPRRRAVLAALVIVGTLTAAAAIPAGAAEAPSAERVLIVVSVAPDGDAEWRVTYRYRLDDENDTRAFDSVRERIEADPEGYASRFADGMAESVAAAENATGREMALRNVTVATRREPIPQGDGRAGLVTYRFTWEAFAAANDTHLAAGEAIAGFYLSPETSLSVTWPEEYRLVGAVPSADERGDRRLTWNGELAFADDEPRVRLVEEARDAPATGPEADAGGGGLPTVPLALAGLAALGVAGGLGAVALRRRYGGRATDGATGAATDELLSDEERVLAALEDHGGRLKQQDVAQACDWHPSKTSKVVTDMDEAGTVEVFRLGRENVVTLPEEALDEID